MNGSACNEPGTKKFQELDASKRAEPVLNSCAQVSRCRPGRPVTGLESLSFDIDIAVS